MKFYYYLITLFLLSSCMGQNNKDKASLPATPVKAPPTYADTITQMENQSMNVGYDSLGQLISKISFDVKTNDLSDYDNGIRHWVRIDSPQLDLKTLVDKDEVVIADKKINVLIDYPVNNNYIFELSSPSGFTRAQLLNAISKHYYLMYAEEEKTASIKTIPVNQRKIYNRNETDGKYGIWGHDIGDLVLDEIHIYKNGKGEITLVLQMES